MALALDWIVVDGRREPVQVVMRVTAEIKTGERKVIDYLLSPVMEGGQGSGAGTVRRVPCIAKSKLSFRLSFLSKVSHSMISDERSAYSDLIVDGCRMTPRVTRRVRSDATWWKSRLGILVAGLVCGLSQASAAPASPSWSNSLVYGAENPMCEAVLSNLIEVHHRFPKANYLTDTNER